MVQQDGRANTVFRAVRTTLNEMVKLKREGIRNHLKLIPSSSELHYWIQQMLANSAQYANADELDDGAGISPC